MKKLFFTFLFLTSFFLGKDIFASPADFQTGIKYGLGATSYNYQFGGPTNYTSRKYQQIDPTDCTLLNENGKCEVNAFEFYFYFQDAISVTVSVSLYEADILPINTETIGTLKRTYSQYVNNSYYGSVVHFFASSTLFEFDNSKFYTVVYSDNQNTYPAGQLQTYDTNVYPDLFSKYIAASSPSWSNVNYDIVGWFTAEIVEQYIEGYDYNLDVSSPDFSTGNGQLCVIGEDCFLWFAFNELAIGDPMYLVYYASSTVIENAIATTTVTASPFWQDKILVPQPLEEGVIKYNLFLVDDVFGWVVKTGFSITWVTSETWDEMTNNNTPGYCAEEVVCENVATSSDFLFGVQCGFQQGICWLTSPTESSKIYVSDSVVKLENSFPFNLYFSFINRMSTIVNTQSTSTETEIIGLPFYNGEDFYSVPLISSSTMSTALGSSFDTFKNGLVDIIWIITSLIIIAVIWIVL